MIRAGCNTQAHLNHFEFLGRLFGAALRTRVLLPLSLPSLFWKPLVGQECHLADLEAVAQSLVDGLIRPLRSCTSKAEFEAAFGSGVLKWKTKLADGTTVDLRDHVVDTGPAVAVGDSVRPQARLSGWDIASHWDSDGEEGEDRLGFRGAAAAAAGGSPSLEEEGDSQGDEDDDVVFEERFVYADALESAWLSQQKQQLAAIRLGMSQVIPAGVLTLFTDAEMERLLCGRATIDVAMLKRHTEYSGLTGDEPHVGYFWQVLEEFGQEERRRFIKFAWGQERLPSTDEDFNRYPRTRMLIKACTSGPVRTGQPRPQSRGSRTGSDAGDGTGDEGEGEEEEEGVGEEEDERSRVDMLFPTADTCFFNIMLPAYSSLAVMRERLTAIVSMNVWGMDGDDVVLDEFGQARAAPRGAGFVQTDERW